MADSKITALTEATTITSDDLFVIVDSPGTSPATQKATASTVQKFMVPPGITVSYVGTTAPAGWLLCNGDAVSRATYAALYAIIGTAYGVGDGSTTFNVPNLKGRVPVGLDSTQTEFDTRGETGGAKTHTLTTAQLPSHTHSIPAHKHDINRATTQAASGTGGGYEVDGAGATAYTETENAPADTTGSTGGGDAHNNLQPYLVVNYIIKT